MRGKGGGEAAPSTVAVRGQSSTHSGIAFGHAFAGSQLQAATVSRLGYLQGLYGAPLARREAAAPQRHIGHHQLQLRRNKKASIRNAPGGVTQPTPVKPPVQVQAPVTALQLPLPLHGRTLPAVPGHEQVPVAVSQVPPLQMTPFTARQSAK